MGPIRDDFGITDFQFSLLQGAAFALLYTFAGLALIIGGLLFDFYDGLDVLTLPGIGTIKPWQATLVTVGAPGLLMSLLFLTIVEPARKGLVTSADGNHQQMPIREVAQFIWQRRGTYLCLFFGSSMMAMADYRRGAWYPELFSRNYGMSKSEAGVS